MTNGEPVLEERLRSQLHGWAERAFPETDDAGRTPTTRVPLPSPPSELADKTEGDRHRRRRIPVAAVVAAVLAIGVIGLAISRRTENHSPATTGPRHTVPAPVVTDVEWQLTSLTVDGRPLVVPPGGKVRLRFSTSGQFSASGACNDLGANVTIEAHRIRSDGRVGSTLVGCDAARTLVDHTIGSLITSSPTWSVRDGVFRLQSRMVVLDATRAANVFPIDLVVLASSGPDSTSGQWQFGYERDADDNLTWEGRDAPGEPFGNAGLLVEPTGFDVMIVAAGTDAFVFGYVPDSTQRAMYERGTSHTAIALYRLPNGRQVFGQPVGADGGRVVALDSTGNAVATSRVLETS